MVAAIAALVSVVATSLLAWFIGSRVSYGWDEVKRQRESDLAALQSFYRCYGAFYASWKMWSVYLRNHGHKDSSSRLPAADPVAWEILQQVESAEGGFEAILIKLASEYAGDRRDRLLLASFRQGAQSLRESIRDGKDLTWKAQPHSPRDGNSNDQSRRLLDYRKYRAFKALCEYIAIKLAHGSFDVAKQVEERENSGLFPDQLSPRSGRRPVPVLLGLRPTRMINQNIAIKAFIEVTQTEGVGGHWYEIAEREFDLPPVK